MLKIDNTTAIAYINKMGGTRYPMYNLLSREIWGWAELRGIYLFASYIASKDNVVADYLSRIKNNDVEWKLADFAYQYVTNKFGPPQIDLFASYWNRKCDLFVSWFPEVGAFETDAFTMDWSKLDFYAFPPFSLILRTLVKIKYEKAEGIIVVPNWPNQPWFPLLNELVAQNYMILGPYHNLLESVHREPHPRASSLSLIAGRISNVRL